MNTSGDSKVKSNTAPKEARKKAASTVDAWPKGEIFHALREIMSPYARTLLVENDSEEALVLNTHRRIASGRPLFFGAVRTAKNYIGYHLMPVYVNPQLLDDISPGLRKRMQGKSCFNFKAMDETLFRELASLTEKAFEDYRSAGHID